MLQPDLPTNVTRWPLVAFETVPATGSYYLSNPRPFWITEWTNTYVWPHQVWTMIEKAGAEDEGHGDSDENRDPVPQLQMWTLQIQIQRNTPELEMRTWELRAGAAGLPLCSETWETMQRKAFHCNATLFNCNPITTTVRFHCHPKLHLNVYFIVNVQWQWHTSTMQLYCNGWCNGKYMNCNGTILNPYLCVHHCYSLMRH